MCAVDASTDCSPFDVVDINPRRLSASTPAEAVVWLGGRLRRGEKRLTCRRYALETRDDRLPTLMH